MWGVPVTNTPVPTPGGDDESENAVLNAAETILMGEAEQVNVEGILMLAIRVGIMLNKWQELMAEHYSKEWIEGAAMTMFHKFFTPFVAPWNDDDD